MFEARDFKKIYSKKRTIPLNTFIMWQNIRPILLAVLLLNCTSIFGQGKNSELFRGLVIGMQKNNAELHFQKNQNYFESIQFGDGVVFTAHPRNFVYTSMVKLEGLRLYPRFSELSGLRYDVILKYLNQIKSYFVEGLDYKIAYQSFYWNAPYKWLSKNYVLGLVLESPNQKTIIHVHPIEYTVYDAEVLNIQIDILSKDLWVGLQRSGRIGEASQLVKLNL